MAKRSLQIHLTLCLGILLLSASLLCPKQCLASDSSGLGWGGYAVDHLYGGLTSSFYDSTTEKWQWMGPAFMSATLLSSFLSYKYLDHQAQPGTENQAWGTFGSGLSHVGNYLPYSLPVGFFLAGQLMPEHSSKRHKTLETAEMLAESLALTFATTFAVKGAVNRQRPNGESYSFPSGHTSLNFATAGVLAMQYPWFVGVPALAVATGVGFTRIDGQKHYLSDVMVGAGIGLFFSTSVHLYHKHSRAHAKKKSSSEGDSPSFMPLITDDTYGLTLASAF